jgi:hypothetical protein
MINTKKRFLLLLLGLAGLLVSCDSKEKMFVQRKSGETGITFANRLTDSDSVNVLSFEYMYNGAGVGVGDFNNDGLADIYFAGNQVSSQLYINKGDFHFQDITEISKTGTDVWCTGVSVADVNQDGWADIYVSVAGPTKDTTLRTNKLFINNGKQTDNIPTFTESAAQYGLNDNGYSTQAAFFDYDQDGDLDCYVLTNSMESANRNAIAPKMLNGESPSTDRLYRNDGVAPGMKSPRFVNVSRETGILAEGYGLGICISDLDDNGLPDIYCANDFLSNDLIWLNKRNTAAEKLVFSNQAANLLKHQTHNAMGVDIADINNDALPDIVVLDMLPPGNYRQKMMLPGSNYNRFQMQEQLGYQPQFMRNTLQLNRGKSLVNSEQMVSFSEIGQLAGIEKTDWSWAPLLADLDNDGWKDLYITNGYRRDVTNLDFIAFNQDMGAFGTPKAKFRNIKDELYNLPEVNIPKYAYRNRGNDPGASLRFEDVSERWGLNQLGYSNGAAYADFDNDGDLDLVTNNIDDEAFILENRLNNSKKTDNQAPHWLRLNIAPQTDLPVVIGTKVWLYAGNQVQMQELAPVRGFVSTVENMLHFGLGTVNAFDSLVIRYPNGQKQTLQNCKINAILTVKYRPEGEWKAAAEPAPMFTEILEKQSGLLVSHQGNSDVDFNRTPLLPHQYSKNGPCLATGDVNGDQLDDFFLGSDYGQLSKVHIQHANGHFTTVTLPGSEGFEDMGAAFFDADGDGDQDLYVVSGGSREEGLSKAYQDRLYLNDGAADPNFRLATAALPVTLSSGSCVSVGDFDGDGDLDIFRGGRIIPGQYPKPADSYLFRNEGNTAIGARFSDVTDQLAPGLRHIGLVTASVWTDTDHDKRADLMLVGEWMAPTLFHNEGGKLVIKKTEGLSNATGWWCSLLAGDFDGDGDTDYVAGNLGLNCKFRASETEPVRIFADDFDHNGRLDPILTFYLDHEHVPVAQRDVLMLQIPSIRKRFPKYNDYASHPFEELFTKEERTAAYVREATQMASCYIENKGKTGFLMHQLPIEAQMAPIYGIQSDDFNGDGKQDLLLAGNFYGAETIGGQQDAGKGLMLAGDGAGHFRTIPNSGLRMDKDARSLARLQRKDGSVWWLVGNNGGQLGIWAAR